MYLWNGENVQLSDAYILELFGLSSNTASKHLLHGLLSDVTFVTTFAHFCC